MKIKALLLSLLLFASPVVAEQVPTTFNCIPIAEAQEILEPLNQVFEGLNQSGSLLELYTDGNNFISFLLTPDGKACLIGIGTQFSLIPQGEPT